MRVSKSNTSSKDKNTSINWLNVLDKMKEYLLRSYYESNYDITGDNLQVEVYDFTEENPEKFDYSFNMSDYSGKSIEEIARSLVDTILEGMGEPNRGQEYTSKNTSINGNKLPAIFKLVHFNPGTTNLDYGGGKFDNVTEYLEDMGVTNLVYDPFNRSVQHNRDVLSRVRKQGGADTVTISNVLNVIQEESVRKDILIRTSKLVKPGGNVYITVYEGNGSGESAPTKSGYQRNLKTEEYLEEIKEVYPDAIRKGKLIVCYPDNSVGKQDIKSSEYYDYDDWVRQEEARDPYYWKELGDENDYLDFHLDAIVDIDSDGDWEYDYDHNDPFNNPDDRFGDWYGSEYSDVMLCDGDRLMDYVSDLIYTFMPAGPGRYHIEADVYMEFLISGLQEKEEKNWPGWIEIYTDEAEVEYLPKKSEVNNFKFKEIK